MMRATPIAIDWSPGLPIFASEPFLKAVGDEYGWLGGLDESGTLRCILPYTIIRRFIFRIVRFRVETIVLGEALDVHDEKSFLTSAMDYFRNMGADLVMPATTNAVFRTYPDGSNAAPYGSYVIDLSEAEDMLWRKIERITRQNINTAKKSGVEVRVGGTADVSSAYRLINETFHRSKLPFMSQLDFTRYLGGLGSHGRLLIAERAGITESCAVFAYSSYCAYAVYAGNLADQSQGANKLLYWEALRMFKELGVQRFDFVGARIDPEKGSKQEAINSLKRRFGATLVRGFLWKYPLHPIKYRLYGLAARLRSGGDIVDAERHKLGLPASPQ